MTSFPYKLLFISHESKLYGAPKSMLLLAEALKDCYDVSIITYGQGDLVDACHVKGLPVEVMALRGSPSNRFDLFQKLKNRWFMLLSFLELINRIHQKKPDLVYVNTVARAQPLLAAWLLRKKRLVHVREGGDYLFPSSRQRWISTFWIFHFCPNFLCVSESIKRSVEKRLDDKRVRVKRVYNGICLKDFLSGFLEVDDNLSELPSELKIVGFLGNLVPRKRVDLFLSAAAKIIKKRNDIGFYVVGGDRERFFEMAELEGVKEYLGKFIFHDSFVRNPVHAFEKMDVFCMTSDIEPFSRVNLESAIMKVPIVATAVDGNLEFVSHNKTGLLFPAGDAAALENCIIELIDDEVKRREIVESAYARVLSEFTLERYVREADEFVKKVLMSK